MKSAVVLVFLTATAAVAQPPYRPAIPKTWDAAALQSLEVPQPNASYSPVAVPRFLLQCAGPPGLQNLPGLRTRPGARKLSGMASEAGAPGDFRSCAAAFAAGLDQRRRKVFDVPFGFDF